MSNHRLILVSACLAGLQTRYDNRIVESPACIEQLKACGWIPVCPEQLGGLSTPRPAADIVGGDGAAVLDGAARVICADNTDVTDAFVKGAHQVLKIAEKQPISSVYLKSRSPSCGFARLGVTAALLARHGFELIEFN
jgi:uncharacterized protein YbbK (DUF523 family)